MEQQKYYERLAEEIDKYGSSDQRFILYYLLPLYINDCEEQLDKLNYEVSKENYALVSMLQEHKRVGESMRTILGFDLF